MNLAKLSLWLVTLSKELLFTLVDHAIKCGDSLAGVSRKEIEAALKDAAKQRELWEGKLQDFRQQEQQRFELFHTDSRSAADEERKREPCISSRRARPSSTAQATCWWQRSSTPASRRSTGLRWICFNGGTIDAARKRTKWPGVAAVDLNNILEAASAIEAATAGVDGVSYGVPPDRSSPARSVMCPRNAATQSAIQLTP